MKDWNMLNLEGKYAQLASFFADRLSRNEIRVFNHQHLMEALNHTYDLTKSSGDIRYMDNFAHNTGLITADHRYMASATIMQPKAMRKIADNINSVDGFIYYCHKQDWERAAQYYYDIFHICVPWAELRDIVTEKTEVLDDAETA